VYNHQGNGKSLRTQMMDAKDANKKSSPERREGVLLKGINWDGRRKASTA